VARKKKKRRPNNPPSPPPPTATVVRKNQASLTADEKSRFVAACKVLKANGMWDHHVEQHRTAMLSMNPDPAHGGPAFLPWHRECLLRLEQDLRVVDSGVSIPYWDAIRDRSPTSSIWAPNFMGGNGDPSRNYEVTTGPFAYSTGQWTLNVNDTPSTPPYLRRFFGQNAGTLPTIQNESTVLSRIPYDASPWNSNTRSGFRQILESLIHNVVHNWVGGTMTGATSPNDPIFYMHHCNVDRLWARWQKRWPSEAYIPISGGPNGHNLNDGMWPWSTESDPPKPASIWDHSTLDYAYDDEASW
jgi:tyrosinase